MIPGITVESNEVTRSHEFPQTLSISKIIFTLLPFSPLNLPPHPLPSALCPLPSTFSSLPSLCLLPSPFPPPVLFKVLVYDIEKVWIHPSPDYVSRFVMPSQTPETSELKIRPCVRRDLDAIEGMLEADTSGPSAEWQHLRRWYGLLKGLSLFPNPFQHVFSNYVAEQGDRLRGMIQVSPFNKTRSTWRIDRLLLDNAVGEKGTTLPTDVGSQLIRYCLQSIWEARTWLMEVEVGDDMLLGLSRQNGFQPLAHLTYWAIAPELLESLAQEEPDLPNLLPVSNADAGLLHQLDTFSMPPTLRQVFDRHVVDFRRGLLTSITGSLRHWSDRTEVVRGYVFQPQRKAAIGYFQLNLCRDGSHPHSADLTVHPEYTWLYAELLRQMARAIQAYPAQSLQLTSADYQTEREEYLDKLGADPTGRALLLSRSVWHKVREARPLEALQIADMLQSLQPSRTPIPSRFSLTDFWQRQKLSDKANSFSNDSAHGGQNRLPQRKASRSAPEDPLHPSGA